MRRQHLHQPNRSPSHAWCVPSEATESQAVLQYAVLPSHDQRPWYVSVSKHACGPPSSEREATCQRNMEKALQGRSEWSARIELCRNQSRGARGAAHASSARRHASRAASLWPWLAIQHATSFHICRKQDECARKKCRAKLRTRSFVRSERRTVDRRSACLRRLRALAFLHVEVVYITSFAFATTPNACGATTSAQQCSGASSGRRIEQCKECNFLSTSLQTLVRACIHRRAVQPPPSTPRDARVTRAFRSSSPADTARAPSSRAQRRTACAPGAAAATAAARSWPRRPRAAPTPRAACGSASQRGGLRTSDAEAAGKRDMPGQSGEG
eukprot:4831254-Pleurochrysis_carterae.AAC.1